MLDLPVGTCMLMLCPETLSIASLNIQGCKHTEKEEEQGKGKGADKLDAMEAAITCTAQKPTLLKALKLKAIFSLIVTTLLMKEMIYVTD